MISWKYQLWHFQVFWWKLAKFLMSFSKPHSAFLEILHDCSVSWKITHLYFFRRTLYTLLERDQSKCKFLRLLSARIKFTKFLSFLKQQISFFFQILHHFSALWDTTSLYFSSWNFMYFQQKKPIKVKIWWNFTWVVESLKFCSLMASFCKNKVSANKVQKSYLSWHWRVMQNLKKNWFVVSNMTWGMVLTKMRNDLKRPETTYNEPETTWNDLQRLTTSKKGHEATWNDLQQARNDLKRPTTTWKGL